MLVTGALLGAALTLLATDDDSPADEAESLDDSAPTTSSSRPTTTAAPTTSTTAQVAWQEVGDDQGLFRMSIPGGWTYVSLDGDLSDAGDRMFPDDPIKSGLVDLMADLMTAPQAKLLAVDAQTLGGATLAAFVRVEGSTDIGGISGYDAVLRACEDAVQAQGLTLGAEGSLATPVGEMRWLEVQEATGGTTVEYFLLHAGWLWKLSFTTQDLARERPIADQASRR